MKRLLVVAFALLLVLGFSAVSSASVSIEGLYVTGTQSYDLPDFGIAHLIKGSADGYALIARTSLIGPFGAEVHYTSLTGNDVESPGDGLHRQLTGEIAKTDTFLTYQPFAALELFAGYTQATTTVGDPLGYGFKTKVSGPVAGLQSGFTIGDKISVDGFYGFGLGAKLDANYFMQDPEDADVTSLKVAVKFALNPTFTLEAGYTSDTAKSASVDAAEVEAYFAGAKASF